MIAVGERYGRLEVIDKGPPALKHRKAQVRCDCGVVKLVGWSSLQSGDARSCGCLQRELVAKRTVRHGMSGTRTWQSWAAMTERCSNPKNPNYVRYGGRGILVCESWKVFENFYADMGERPASKSIDRIDNNRGYEKSNCRWATAAEQNQNTSQVILTADDVRDIRARAGTSVSEMSRRYGVSRRTISAIIARKSWADVSDLTCSKGCDRW